MPLDSQERLRRRLVELRKQSGASKRAVAKAAGVAESHLSAFLNPATKKGISLEKLDLVGLARFFRTTVDGLFDLSDAPDTESVQRGETKGLHPPSDVVGSERFAPQQSTTESSGRTTEGPGSMPLTALGTFVLDSIGKEMLVSLAALQPQHKLWLQEQIAALMDSIKLPEPAKKK